MEEAATDQAESASKKNKPLFKWLILGFAFLGVFAAGIAVRHYNIAFIMNPLYDLRESLKDEPEAAAPDGQFFTLRVRQWLHPKHRDASKGADAQYHFEERNFESAKTALVVMDAWDFEAEHLRVHAEERMPKIVKEARRLGVLVIFAPHGRKLAKGLSVEEGDVLLSHDDSSIKAFKALLDRRGIRRLIYSGYATNMCVINRPIGLFNMAKEGFKSVMIRDATLGNDVPGDPDGEWARAVTIHQIENVFGGTSTIKALQAAEIQNP